MLTAKGRRRVGLSHWPREGRYTPKVTTLLEAWGNTRGDVYHRHGPGPVHCANAARMLNLRNEAPRRSPVANPSVMQGIPRRSPIAHFQRKIAQPFVIL